ncbi:MAG: ParB N-terminal domain-containing protein [Nitrososphaerales archaeon]|jgi:hypothetical protein
MAHEPLVPVAVESLPVSNLVPNDYSTNRMGEWEEMMLRETMKETGRCPANLKARCLGEEEDHAKHKHEIIDGLHRWSIARELGFESLPCEIYRTDRLHASALSYLVNTARGSRDAFLEGKAFADALRESGDAGKVCEAFKVTREYVMRRVRLVRLWPFYQRYGTGEKLTLSHWQVLAAYWKSSEDDQVLEEALNFLVTDPVGLGTVDLKRFLAELSRDKKRLAAQAEKEKASALASGEKPPEDGEPGRRGKQEEGETTTSFKRRIEYLKRGKVADVEVLDVPAKYVRGPIWDDKTPPTSTYYVNCEVCRDEKSVAIWEEVVVCRDCKKPVVDEKGNLVSTVKEIRFRPRKKPYERIYGPEKYEELGIEQVLKRRSQPEGRTKGKDGRKMPKRRAMRKGEDSRQ